MIKIVLNDQSFRYDVHSLVKAFYPSEELNFDIINQKCNELSIDFRDELMVMVPEAEIDRKGLKNLLKQSLYKVLQDKTGISLAWGTLTGIRPVKIPVKLLSEGKSEADVYKYMKEVYLTSDEKIRLATDIAKKQLSIINPVNAKNSVSIYIGIPFCPSICAYCSFSSYPYGTYRDRVKAYIDALISECKAVVPFMENKRIASIYIGGGTPSTLSAEELEILCENIKRIFNISDLSGIKEFSVECGRPDSITAEKLKVLKAQGVSRICINPQTMNDKTLKLIGRNHTGADIENAFYMAREAGLNNINMDLIAGLPEEGREEVKHTLDKIKVLNPDSITIHSLAIKRASRLNLDWDENISYGEVTDVMDLFSNAARDMGLFPYYLYRQKQISGNLENIGYARDDSISIYNILIMGEFHDIIAFGAGSISKFLDGENKPVRVANVKDVDVYIDRINEMIERKREWLLRKSL